MWWSWPTWIARKRRGKCSERGGRAGVEGWKPALLRPAANFIPNLRNGRANELLNYSVASRKGGGEGWVGEEGRERERGGTPGVDPKFSNGERNDGGWAGWNWERVIKNRHVGFKNKRRGEKVNEIRDDARVTEKCNKKKKTTRVYVFLFFFSKKKKKKKRHFLLLEKIRDVCSFLFVSFRYKWIHINSNFRLRTFESNKKKNIFSAPNGEGGRSQIIAKMVDERKNSLGVSG